MKLIYLRYLICVILFFPLNSSAQIYINELVSSNSGGIADPDYDDTSDWIELYNDSNAAIDLSEYFLTDNLNNTTKWQFPTGTVIDANGYLLLWTDGLDNGLHTNFKLTKDGEEVGLFDGQGNLIDSIIYNNQQTDISYGRKTDGNPTWGFFDIPTPAASNTSTAYDGIVFYRPRFSVKGGIYENNITVEMSAIDGEIHYTTDGSLPTWSSPIYTSPLNFSSTTILRASVFLPNFITGKPTTQSYFINENLAERKLPVISIATNPDYFWDNNIGLYVQNFKPSWEYPINIELFENDGGDRSVINELAGIRINGLFSWQSPQKMLGIYFDNEYDQNNIDYPLFFDRQRRKFDTFILRPSGSDWASTLIRDGLMQGLTQGMMDLEITGFRPSIVFVNGEYLGIHNLRSRMDDGFIEEHLGQSGVDYDLINNNGEVEEGDSVAFTQLFNLLNNDLTNLGNYYAVADVMDIDNCIDFYITEIWASNSSYGHNISFWKPKTPNSKWRWLIQDFDRGFFGDDDDTIDDFTVDPVSVYEWVAIPFTNLLNNNIFSDAFLNRFATQLFTTYHPQRVAEHIENKTSAIEKEIPFHVDRWEGMNSGYADAIPSFKYWQEEVQDLHNFSQERSEFLYSDLINHFDVNKKSVLGISSFPERGGNILINDVPLPENNWAGYYFEDLEFELKAEPSAGYEFQGWSEAAVEVLIEKESVWKYLDNGTSPGNNWTTLNFNDAPWDEGQGQLGYGDNDENTTLSFGNDSNDKHVTTYFRKSFNINNPSEYAGQLVINILKDDGAIIYINGKEVTRTNLPKTNVTSETYATRFVAGDLEEFYNFYSINVNELLQGENIIAVELHQASANSSDLSFDLELKALKKDLGNIISTDKTLTTSIFSDKVYAANYVPLTTCILSDSILTNTTLTIDCSPYLALRKIVVAPDVTLTVDAGVEILFSSNAKIQVNGNLNVEGSEDLPVRFLPNLAEGTLAWDNLFFENTTDTSFLNWLEIEAATFGSHPIKENAAIAAWNSILKMDNLTIENTYGNPILTRYSDIWLTNSKLHSIITGDLINVKYGYGFIDNCEFRGNNQIDTDAIDYDEVINGEIRNSKIYNFLGFNSDGIDLGEESKDVLIENNFIHHISDKGISVGQQSTIQSYNNTLVECNQGFGIKDEAMIFIDQTTFYNNAYDVAAFEKNIGSGGGYVEIHNTIFSNTAFAPVQSDEASDIQVEYSISDTDSLFGNSVIYGNALLDNPASNNFQIQVGSPAINSGMSPSGNVNMGTSIFNYSAAPSILISAIHYHPVDNADAEFIEIYNPRDEAVLLDGYNFTDGIEFIFPTNVSINAGERIRLAKDISFHSNFVGQVFQWNSGKLSNDGEQLILRDAYSIIVDHVTYNDQLPWPIEADGMGSVLTLYDFNLDNHFAESWVAEEVITSIETIFNNNDITFFPNPTNDVINIQSSGDELKSIILFDALGRRLKDIQTTENFITIDLREYFSGVFFIKVDGVVIGKVILNK